MTTTSSDSTVFICLCYFSCFHNFKCVNKWMIIVDFGRVWCVFVCSCVASKNRISIWIMSPIHSYLANGFPLIFFYWNSFDTILWRTQRCDKCSGVRVNSGQFIRYTYNVFYVLPFRQSDEKFCRDFPFFASINLSILTPRSRTVFCDRFLFRFPRMSFTLTQSAMGGWTWRTRVFNVLYFVSNFFVVSSLRCFNFIFYFCTCIKIAQVVLDLVLPNAKYRIESKWKINVYRQTPQTQPNEMKKKKK